jgi:hypothetical protein
MRAARFEGVCDGKGGSASELVIDRQESAIAHQ